MTHVDFGSEAAEVYIETVRLATRAGVLETLPHRPPCDRAEAELAGQVRRRVERTLIGLSAPAAQRAPGMASASCARCCLCGGMEDVRLWRMIWPRDGGPRLDLYRCRAGCPSA